MSFIKEEMGKDRSDIFTKKRYNGVVVYVRFQSNLKKRSNWMPYKQKS